MQKWSSTTPASPSVRRLRLLAASYLRDWYRSSHLPFGNNQRKNRLVVRCMFSCGIEPKWLGPRCWEHKNRLRLRYGNFKSTVCPWNNFILNQELNLSSPSLILNVFSPKRFYDKNAVLIFALQIFLQSIRLLATSASPMNENPYNQQWTRVFRVNLDYFSKPSILAFENTCTRFQATHQISLQIDGRLCFSFLAFESAFKGRVSLGQPTRPRV